MVSQGWTADGTAGESAHAAFTNVFSYVYLRGPAPLNNSSPFALWPHVLEQVQGSMGNNPRQSAGPDSHKTPIVKEGGDYEKFIRIFKSFSRRYFIYGLGIELRCQSGLWLEYPLFIKVTVSVEYLSVLTVLEIFSAMRKNCLALTQRGNLGSGVCRWPNSWPEKILRSRILALIGPLNFRPRITKRLTLHLNFFRPKGRGTVLEGCWGYYPSEWNFYTF